MPALAEIPTAYGVRNYVEAGGLVSYGASFTDAARQVPCDLGTPGRKRLEIARVLATEPRRIGADAEEHAVPD